MQKWLVGNVPFYLKFWVKVTALEGCPNTHDTHGWVAAAVDGCRSQFFVSAGQCVCACVSVRMIRTVLYI